jgi:hypothetical protein
MRDNLVISAAERIAHQSRRTDKQVEHLKLHVKIATILRPRSGVGLHAPVAWQPRLHVQKGAFCMFAAISLVPANASRISRAAVIDREYNRAKTACQKRSDLGAA